MVARWRIQCLGIQGGARHGGGRRGCAKTVLRLFKDDKPGVRAKIEMILSPSGADTPPQRTPERKALAAAHAAQLMSQRATMDGLAKGISAHKGKYRVRLTLTSAVDGGVYAQ